MKTDIISGHTLQIFYQVHYIITRSYTKHAMPRVIKSNYLNDNDLENDVQLSVNTFLKKIFLISG